MATTGNKTTNYSSTRRVINSRDVPKGELDFYATPEWATEAFLSNVKPFQWLNDFVVWEPACGDGKMSEVLKTTFSNVISSDIVDRGYKDSFVYDFLDESNPLPVEVKNAIDNNKLIIITNPPFSYAERFVNRALRLTKDVSIIARLSWLEGKARYEDIFKINPPDEVHIFCKRVGFLKGGDEKWRKKAGVAANAWYLWSSFKNNKYPEIKWI